MSDTTSAPTVLMATVTHDGGDYSLCLIRSRFKSEGFAVLERLAPTGELDFAQHGTWEIDSSRDEEGAATPTTLSLDFDDSGDVDDFACLLDALMARLVQVGGSWGIDAYSPLGTYN